MTGTSTIMPDEKKLLGCKIAGPKAEALDNLMRDGGGRCVVPNRDAILFLGDFIRCMIAAIERIEGANSSRDERALQNAIFDANIGLMACDHPQAACLLDSIAIDAANAGNVWFDPLIGDRESTLLRATRGTERWY